MVKVVFQEQEKNYIKISYCIIKLVENCLKLCYGKFVSNNKQTLTCH